MVYDYLKNSPSVGRGILRGGALATENLLGIPARDIASDVSQGHYGRALGKGGMSLGIGLATHQAGKAAKSSAANRRWAGSQVLPRAWSVCSRAWQRCRSSWANASRIGRRSWSSRSKTS